MDKYFAASNSAQGFFSYYNDCFSECDKLYIIKGGPGTGKSGFMRACSRYAEERGSYVEYFFCSSDPDSLDGVIIHNKNKSIAIIDGTSPHVYDMELPGVRDNIINLGEAWDEGALDKSREMIFSLCHGKTEAYRRAYNALAICGNLTAVMDSYVGEFVLSDKMRDSAQRLVERYCVSGEGKRRIRLIDSVSMKGRVRFDTFERNATNTVIIGDTYCAGNIMLEKIKGALDGLGADYYVSYDPVITRRINGIFDTGSRTAFMLSDSRMDSIENERAVVSINTRRFIDDGIKDVKGDIKYSLSLYRSSIDLALKMLYRAKGMHFALEEIYKGAMDFSLVDKRISDFCKIL